MDKQEKYTRAKIESYVISLNRERSIARLCAKDELNDTLESVREDFEEAYGPRANPPSLRQYETALNISSKAGLELPAPLTRQSLFLFIDAAYHLASKMQRNKISEINEALADLPGFSSFTVVPETEKSAAGKFIGDWLAYMPAWKNHLEQIEHFERETGIPALKYDGQITKACAELYIDFWCRFAGQRAYGEAWPNTLHARLSQDGRRTVAESHMTHIQATLDGVCDQVKQDLQQGILVPSATGKVNTYIDISAWRAWTYAPAYDKALNGSIPDAEYAAMCVEVLEAGAYFQEHENAILVNQRIFISKDAKEFRCVEQSSWHPYASVPMLIAAFGYDLEPDAGSE